MTKQKKSFLDKIVGAKEKDLEESINLEQDLDQSEEFADKHSNEKEPEQELDDVSKEQIKKDILESEKREMKKTAHNSSSQKNEIDQEESKKNTSEKWLGDSESLSNENGEEGQLAIDVYQTVQDIIIKSIVGGVKSEELDISINNDMVTIKGVRQNPDKVASEDYYYQECFWGNFSRSVILPTEVDVENIKAAIKNGILTVKLPKLKKTVSRKIKVESA